MGEFRIARAEDAIGRHLDIQLLLHSHLDVDLGQDAETVVVANMIGAGVFTSSGFSLAVLGNPGRVMLAWLICGVWAICGSIAYGALIKRLPESGGEYLFLSRLVHPAIGFLAGWISIVAGFTAPITAAALGAAIYSLPGAAADAPQVYQLAAAIIIVAVGCHLVGLSLGTRIQNSIVIAKLLLIGITIVWALGFTSPESWQGQALDDHSTPFLPEDFSAWVVLAGSMSWIALSYTGFNAAVYVAGESRQARTEVPIAMVLATLVVTAVYLLLNYVYVYAPRPDQIAGQAAVATLAAESIGGKTLENLSRVTIVLAMVSSVFAMLLAGPRVYQKMAQDGVMPAIFRGATGSPRVAIAVQACLSLLALLWGDLLQLMKYLGLTLSACGALAILSVLWLRFRLADAPRLRWWETFSIAIYLGVTACILAASRTEHADEFKAMLYTFAAGLLFWGIWEVMRLVRARR